MNKKVISLILLLFILFPFTNSQARAHYSQSEVDFNEIKQQNWANLAIHPMKKENFSIVIANPAHNLVLVNKNRKLPSQYEPENLVIPDINFLTNVKKSKRYMKKEAAKALEELFNQANRENIKLAGISAYRSYKTQQKVFAYHTHRLGKRKAEQVSAHPGESEHQTGLAIDVSSASVNYRLIKKLGQIKEGKWLAQNAPNYGFIIRYPKRKSQITGYQYEPWHLRYVGVKHAKIIAQHNLTLEEYLYNQYSPQKKQEKQKEKEDTTIFTIQYEK